MMFIIKKCSSYDLSKHMRAKREMPVELWITLSFQDNQEEVWFHVIVYSVGEFLS